MQIVTKGEFAALIGRSPAAVSGYLKAGKIGPEALVGQGHNARIRVDMALQQLGMRLDVGQQLAQATVVGPSLLPPAAAPAWRGEAADSQARIAAAKAEREELALREDRARHAAMEGRWVEAGAMRAELGAALARQVAATELWLTVDAGPEIARTIGGDGARVGAMLRDLYRGFRAREARQAAAEAAEAAEAAGEPALSAEPPSLGGGGTHEFSCQPAPAGA